MENSLGFTFRWASSHNRKPIGKKSATNWQIPCPSCNLRDPLAHFHKGRSKRSPSPAQLSSFLLSFELQYEVHSRLRAQSWLVFWYVWKDRSLDLDDDAWVSLVSSVRFQAHPLPHFPRESWSLERGRKWRKIPERNPIYQFFLTFQISPRLEFHTVPDSKEILIGRLDPVFQGWLWNESVARAQILPQFIKTESII